MTLTDLRYLVALARERHFGHAAERCNVSQPTLSVAIKKLEEELAVTLFERSAADVKITDIGARIVAQAEKVLLEAGQIKELATAGRDPLSGPLKLGVIYTIGPYLLPHLIPRVHAAAPSMPLLIQENYTARLAESLKRGDLDVIVVALPFEEPGIVTQAVYDEPFRVLLPAGHGWESEERIPASRLAEAPLLLLGAGNCFRDQVLEACPLCRPGEGLQRTLEGSSSRPSATWSPPAPASPCCPAPPPTRCPAAIRCSPCAPSPRRNPSAASPWPGASLPAQRRHRRDPRRHPRQPAAGRQAGRPGEPGRWADFHPAATKNPSTLPNNEAALPKFEATPPHY
jgi:LysR family hydrogen peroxide-inducible transcriptional activator